MLYNPPAFREDDLARLHDHMAVTGFATLIAVGARGPIVSHLPRLIEREAGPRGELIGHVARANSQWRDSDLMKLSQNRPEFDRLGVIAGLRASDRQGDRDVADKMDQRRGAKP